MRRLLAAVRLALAGIMSVASFIAPSPADAGACPGRECPTYSLACETAAECRWPAGADGIVRIPYWVNDTLEPWMTEQDTLGAINAAAWAWEKANPRIRFYYQGKTEAFFADDGKFVISWLPTGQDMAWRWRPSSRMGSADIVVDSRTPRAWYQCTQWHGSCGPTAWRYWRQPPNQFVDSLFAAADIQQLLTHELGHVVGLGDRPEESSAGLTMAAAVGPDCDPIPYGSVCRARSTLGLGDILGAKAVYPWSCPGGTGKQRHQYPWEYRQVCPTIEVYAP